MEAKNQNNSLLARYALRLQAYEPWITITYKPGRIHSTPDALSRLPVDLSNDLKDLEDIVVPDEYYVCGIHDQDPADKLAGPYRTSGDPVLLGPYYRKKKKPAEPLPETGPYRPGYQHDSSDSPKLGPYYKPDPLAPPPTTPSDITAEPWSEVFQGLSTENVFLDMVKAEQDSSKFISTMRDYLEGNDRGRGLSPAAKQECEADRNNWVVENGLLKKVVRNPAKKDKAGNVIREASVTMPVVLPTKSQLKPLIFHALHDHPTAAHIGQRKFTKLLRERWYWKGWYQDSQDYISSCDGCQRYKGLRKLRPSCILPIHAPTPFHTLGIDLIGPLPLSRGMSYCLVAIDHFSRWPIIVPLPSKEPKHVAKALFDKVVMDHTCPRKILSDRGGEFDNEVMKHLCKLMGIKHTLSMPYHPATNGKVERFNGFLKKAIAIVCQENGKNWSLYVAHIAFAYRHAPVHATNHTPFEVLYGRKGRLPIDLLTASPDELDISAGRMHAHHLTRLAKIWQQMRDLQATNYEEWDKLADEAGNHRVYNEGEYCLIYMPSRTKGPSAFTTAFRGPFLVLQRLGVKTYRLKSLSTDGAFEVSVDNMIPYNMRKVEDQDDSDSAENDASDDSEAEVAVKKEEVKSALSTPSPDDDTPASDSKPDLRRNEIAPAEEDNGEEEDDESNLETMGRLSEELLPVDDSEELPFRDLSHSDQQKLVKLCISIVNEANAQVLIKRSTIKNIARNASYGVFAKRRLRKGLVIIG